MRLRFANYMLGNYPPTVPIPQRKCARAQITKANFRCRGYGFPKSLIDCCFRVVHMSISLALCLLIACTATKRPTLTGVVVAQDGKPLSNTMVFIYTARPKIGPSVICPYCYLDCRKKATTNIRGEFEIPNLDPTLLFRVGAIAADHEPVFLADVDPAATPVKLTLALKAPLPEDPRCVVRGRLVDPEGEVVMGALIEPKGISYRRDKGVQRMFGPVSNGPTITDIKGSFTLVLQSPAVSAYLMVDARGLARKLFDTPTGSEEITLRLGRGASIKGRILKDGKPLEDVTIGLAQVNRSSGNFVGEFTATTDVAGRFLFTNVVPGEKLVVYGKIMGFGSRGTVSARPFESGAEDSILDLGDIAVEPALTLSGRVTLSDGKTVPPHTRIYVGRMEAWDSAEQELGADGSFHIEGLPREVLDVSVSVPEYGFSPKNGSYIAEVWNPQGSIAGRLDNDATISLLLEPLADLPKVNPPPSYEECQASAKVREEIAKMQKEIEKRAEETRSRPLQGLL
jgi:hypothetical protein